MATHSQDTRANFLRVCKDIESKLTTLESTLKRDFKDQLTKRDNEIDRKFESLRQKVEIDE